MFHLFQTYVASFLSRCCICCSGYIICCTCVAHVCFRRILQQVLHAASVFISRHNMFHALQMYVSYILSECCICCSGYTHTLQWLYTYVASVYSKCFIYFRRMLQIFELDVCICFSGYTHVASVYSKCFICFRRILQMDLSRYCSRYTHMFINISLVSDVCCRSAFMLQH